METVNKELKATDKYWLKHSHFMIGMMRHGGGMYHAPQEMPIAPVHPHPYMG